MPGSSLAMKGQTWLPLPSIIRSLILSILFGTEMNENWGATTPVGRFPANAWGIHDMHGNVYQWRQDFYGPYPKTDAIDPDGPKEGKYHVVRGGSLLMEDHWCRSACRQRRDPEAQSYWVGLRVCLSDE